MYKVGCCSVWGGGITCLCERFAWGTKDCYSAHPQAIFQNDQKGYVKGEIYLSHFEGQMYKRKEELENEAEVEAPAANCIGDEENFMLILSTFLFFWRLKRIAFKSSLDQHFHPLIVEFF